MKVDTNWKRLLAAGTAIFFGGWEAFHWIADVEGHEPWSFGLGLTSAALIFGFWRDAASPVRAEAQREPLDSTPAIEGIDVLLTDLIKAEQEMSKRAKKAAKRLAHYHGS